MTSWLRVLDRILRGEVTKGESLEKGLPEVPLGGMAMLIILLGIVYGMGMGTFSLCKAGGPTPAQFLASAAKTPALFLLTLIITFPSLYVFNALVGSRLSLWPVLRLLISGLAVTMSVLASFGPIVAFFSVSTTSYSFMVLLNVAMCFIAGMLGLGFLRQTLLRLTYSAARQPAASNSIPAAAVTPATTGGAAPPPFRSDFGKVPNQAGDRSVTAVFRCWMLLFALVGSQMGWVLRPFIGSPDQPFTFFRPRDSNFFAAVWEHLLNLFR